MDVLLGRVKHDIALPDGVKTTYFTLTCLEV